MTACFAERRVVAGASAPCRSPRSCRSGRPRCSAAASSPEPVRCGTSRGSQPGDTVCVIGVGGVGMQVVAAARIAGAGDDRRGRPQPRDARARAPSRRDAHGRRDAEPIPRGGARADATAASTTPSRWSGDPRRSGSPGTRSGPAAARSSSAWCRAGSRSRVPGIEFLSDKSLRGTYYGSGDAARELPDLARLAVDGRARPRGRRDAYRRAGRRRACARTAQGRRRRADGRRDRRGSGGNRKGGAGMSGIVERLKVSEERDSDALVAGLEIRTQAFIDGAYVDARVGRDVRLRQPGRRGGRSPRSPRATRPTSTAPSPVRATRLRLGCLVAGGAEAAQARPAQARDADGGARRRARAARDARHGQADPRQPPGRRAARRRDDLVLRRGDRQGLRRDRADRELERRDDRARAARRRRRRRAVELPAADGELEARAGARDRQLASC